MFIGRLKEIGLCDFQLELIKRREISRWEVWDGWLRDLAGDFFLFIIAWKCATAMNRSVPGHRKHENQNTRKTLFPMLPVFISISPCLLSFHLQLLTLNAVMDPIAVRKSIGGVNIYVAPIWSKKWNQSLAISCSKRKQHVIVHRSIGDVVALCSIFARLIKCKNSSAVGVKYLPSASRSWSKLDAVEFHFYYTGRVVMRINASILCT